MQGGGGWRVVGSLPPSTNKAATAKVGANNATSKSTKTQASVEELQSYISTFQEHQGDLFLGLAALLALIALVQTARILWLHGEASRRAKRRIVRAIQGERDAERFVRERGFKILAVQPEYVWQLSVDGRPAQVVLRPDLILERNGRRYVGDVKTGQSAPNPLMTSTRRQLLEYLIACDVDGVLVIDIEARRIRSLVFPTKDWFFETARLRGERSTEVKYKRSPPTNGAIH